MVQHRPSISRLLRWGAIIATLAYLLLGPLDPSERQLSETDDHGEQDWHPRPRRITPGGALLIEVHQDAQQVDWTANYSIAVQQHEIPASRVLDHAIVFALPENLKEDAASVVLLRNGEILAVLDVDIREPNREKLIRNGVGGLSLILFGMWLLARSFGKLGLHLVHSTAYLLAHSKIRSFLAGVLSGIAVQTPRAAIRFFGDLIALELVPYANGVLLLAGSFVGAGLIAALFPLASLSDGLLFVPAGGIGLALAKLGRDRSASLAVIGLGLMLHGLHLTRTGSSEIALSPEFATLLAAVQVQTLPGIAICFAVGIVGGFIIHAPGAFFAIVAALVQTTGLLTVQSAGPVLAGGLVGASLVGALASGKQSARMRATTKQVAILVAGVATCQLLLLPGIDQLLGTDTQLALSRWSPGKKILFPAAHAPLVMNFLTTFIASVLIVATGMQLQHAISRWRKIHQQRTTPKTSEPTEPLVSRRLGLELAAALRQSEELVRSLLPEQSDTTPGDALQRAIGLRSHLDGIETLLTRLMLGEDGRNREERAPLYALGLVLAQLHSTLTHLLSLLQELRENRSDLYFPGDLLELVRQVAGAMTTVADTIEEGSAIDLDDAQQQEIGINRWEAAVRQSLIRGDWTTQLGAPTLGLHSAIAGSLEHIGNEIYRLATTLDRLGLPAGFGDATFDMLSIGASSPMQEPTS